MTTSERLRRPNVPLALRAFNIRRHALRMARVQGQGYIGQALGVADVLAACFFHALNYRPEDPQWEGRDRFLLSVGHYAIALYAALIEAGVIPEEEIPTYGADDSRLPMSGMCTYTPGMEITGGSLGQGLTVAVGMALGLRRKNNPAFVYNLMSDGELEEGASWEAAMAAVRYRLANLICLVDFNGQQADGPSREILLTVPEEEKWRAFGWQVQRVDGHDLEAVVAALEQARGSEFAGPRMVIFDTRMCRGVDFLERRESSHFVRVEPEEWDLALAALERSRPQ